MRLAQMAACTLLVISAAACGGTSSTEQTLLAVNATLSTEAAELVNTATVSADRLRVTLAFAEEEVARLNTQQARIIGTMVERGISVSNLPGVATPVPATQTANARQPAPQIGVTPAAPAAPDVQVTPVTSTPAPTVIGDGPALINAVTAQGVLDDDCANNVTTQFSTAAQEIYVVATAVNIPDGTQIGSRWMQDSVELWAFSLEFGFVEEGCIWFFATPEEFPFTPGAYSVALEINGQVVNRVDFTISDSGAPIGGEAPAGQ